MFQNISRYLPQRKRVLRLLAAWLVLVGTLLLFPGSRVAPPSSHDATKSPESETQLATQKTRQPAPVQQQVASETTTPSVQSKNSKKQPSPPVQQTTPNNNPTTVAPVTPVPADIAVSLELDYVYQGEVTLPSDSNHCEVLSHALAQGVIESLDMRYSSQYKTNAVYIINGIGDSDSVWWTYKVNGKSPPFGCSGVKVQSGDSIN